MKITLNLGSIPNSQKPEKDREKFFAIQRDTSQYKTVELSKALKMIAGQGITFRACAMSGTRRNIDRFYSQQLIALDFDNACEANITPEDVLERANVHELPICAIYPTFSDTPEKRKFRVIFLLDKKIYRENISRLWDIWFYLYQIFPEIDTRCREYNRLYFGSNAGLCYFDENATLKTDSIPIANKSEHEVFAHRKISLNTENKPHTSRIDALKTQRVETPIQLIKQRNTDELRALIDSERKEYTSFREFQKAIYSVPIHQLFGVRLGESIHCFFHDDKSPSAGFYRTHSGTIRYRCQGKCNCDLSTRQFFQAIHNFRSNIDTQRFMSEVFNIHLVQTEETIHAKEEIEEMQRMIDGRNETDSFKKLCPTASANLRFSLPYLQPILSLSQDFLDSDRPILTVIEDGQSIETVYLYVSTKKIVEIRTGKRADKERLEKATKHLKALALHNVLIPMSDAMLRENDYTKAELERAYANRKEHQTRTSFYQIPFFTKRHLERIEQRAREYREANFTISSISYDSVYKFDPTLALKLYPSYAVKHGGEQRQASSKSLAVEEIVAEIVISLIQSQGYATKNQIIDQYMQKMSCGKKSATKAMNYNLPEIMRCNNLRFVTLNNVLRNELHIDVPENSHPKIIVFDR